MKKSHRLFLNVDYDYELISDGMRKRENIDLCFKPGQIGNAVIKEHEEVLKRSLKNMKGVN